MSMLVKREVFVRATRERCFEVFTTKMGTWWPLASHHIGKVDAKDIGMEPREGGRLYEIGVDGSECQWGTVKLWDPPSRFVFYWQLSTEWQFDRAVNTEVHVTFMEEGDGTRVVLEHKNLEAYGEKAEEMKKTFESDGGWKSLLDLFAKAAA